MKNSKAILKTPGTMKIIAADIPVPKEHEVLIKIEYVGICGSDIHGFESGPFIPPKSGNWSGTRMRRYGGGRRQAREQI